MKHDIKVNQQVGRVTPCAPSLEINQPARRGLTRPTFALRERPGGPVS